MADKKEVLLEVQDLCKYFPVLFYAPLSIRTKEAPSDHIEKRYCQKEPYNKDEWKEINMLLNLIAYISHFHISLSD